jgi:hypothetical protein
VTDATQESVAGAELPVVLDWARARARASVPPAESASARARVVDRATVSVAGAESPTALDSARLRASASVAAAVSAVARGSSSARETLSVAGAESDSDRGSDEPAVLMTLADRRVGWIGTERPMRATGYSA